MLPEGMEDYLGAIYRLREAADIPVPLSHLRTYFRFSPVSIHEMVQRLHQQGWVEYHPYRGVLLTDAGEEVARALLRRHRLWERFLTDVLDIRWEDAHGIAGDLEHAAPEMVTEKLSVFLGEPDSCPHGAPIPPEATGVDQCLSSAPVDALARVVRASPESNGLLQAMQRWGMRPGRILRVLSQGAKAVLVDIDEDQVAVPQEYARAIWVEIL